MLPSGHVVPMSSLETVEWPYLQMLARFALALALGLLIGLERERRQKEAGLRTFGFIALLGAVGAAMGDNYAYIMLGLTGMLTIFLNVQEIRTHNGIELTTSAAMLVTCAAGILCGKGHTLTPAAIIVGVTALLAWKDRLSGFSTGLSEDELRSALLLAILGIVIYPALPAGTLGPWGLIEPRATWATVILIAGIGFVNYVLWKTYGTRGVAIAGFLGGLVNSSVTVNELASRAKAHRTEAVIAASRQGILLATAAMLLRNAVILLILAPVVAALAGGSFALMLAVAALWAASPMRAASPPSANPSETSLASPFSLWAALKFGLIFLMINILGIAVSRWFGDAGFYGLSLVAGAVSSASAVASAANLVSSGAISPQTASTGAILASIASVATNLPFVYRAREEALSRPLTSAMAVIAIAGLAGLFLEQPVSELLRRWH
jgi:uncharacterized membrane protein (DUF4010 family)